MKTQRSYFTIALAGPNDAEFFTDSVYKSEADAVADFMTDQYGDESMESRREYVLVEFVSIKRIERVLKPRLEKLDMTRIAKRLQTSSEEERCE